MMKTWISLVEEGARCNRPGGGGFASRLGSLGGEELMSARGLGLPTFGGAFPESWASALSSSGH